MSPPLTKEIIELEAKSSGCSDSIDLSMKFTSTENYLEQTQSLPNKCLVGE